MDVSFILVIGLSAVVTSGLMIFSEVTSRRGSTFRLAFGISSLAGFLVMQPWRAASPEEAGVSLMTLIFIPLWAAIGCVLGAIPAALVISAIRWLARLIDKRANLP
jgi:hypothetical protein